MIDADIPRELRRARNQAAVMLALTLVGLVSFESTIAFVALSINAAVWLVRFWYYAGQIYENTLLVDERKDR